MMHECQKCNTNFFTNDKGSRTEVLIAINISTGKAHVLPADTYIFFFFLPKNIFY
jgi:hypothetical protein